MAVKLIFTFFILTVCIQLYAKLKDNKNSFALIISTALITTIIGNIILPSNLSLFDFFNNENAAINENNLYLSEDIEQQNEIGKGNQKIEIKKSSTIKENIELSSLHENQIEDSSGKEQDEQPNKSSGGGWLLLSIRKKQLYERTVEQELDELLQQIDKEIQESDIKLN